MTKSKAKISQKQAEDFRAWQLMQDQQNAKSINKENFHLGPKVSQSQSQSQNQSQSSQSKPNSQKTKKIPIEIDQFLRNPEQMDLPALYYRLGPQKFFDFIRHVYLQSRASNKSHLENVLNDHHWQNHQSKTSSKGKVAKSSAVAVCPDCGRTHDDLEYADLMSAFDDYELTWDDSGSDDYDDECDDDECDEEDEEDEEDYDEDEDEDELYDSDHVDDDENFEDDLESIDDECVDHSLAMDDCDYEQYLDNDDHEELDDDEDDDEDDYYDKYFEGPDTESDGRLRVPLYNPNGELLGYTRAPFMGKTNTKTKSSKSSASHGKTSGAKAGDMPLPALAIAGMRPTKKQLEQLREFAKTEDLETMFFKYLFQQTMGGQTDASGHSGANAGAAGKKKAKSGATVTSEDGRTVIDMTDFLETLYKQMEKFHLEKEQKQQSSKQGRAKAASTGSAASADKDAKKSSSSGPQHPKTGHGQVFELDETDEDRKMRVRMELAERQRANDRQKAEKQIHRLMQMKHTEQMRQEAEQRRLSKHQQKREKEVEEQRQLEQKRLAELRKKQELRSQVFQRARDGDSAFVREAVYKMGVAAEGLEVLPGAPVSGPSKGSASPGGSAAKNQETLLHLAVRSGDVGLVEFLVNNGATPDEFSTTGLTPLHVACIINQPHCLDYFIENYPECLALATRKPMKSRTAMAAKGTGKNADKQTFPLPIHLAIDRLFLQCVFKVISQTSFVPEKEILTYVKSMSDPNTKTGSTLTAEQRHAWLLMWRVLNRDSKISETEVQKVEQEHFAKQRDLQENVTSALIGQDVETAVSAPEAATENVEPAAASETGKKRRKKKNKKGQTDVTASEGAESTVEPSVSLPESPAAPVDDYLLQQQRLLESFQKQKTVSQKQETKKVDKSANGAKRVSKPPFASTAKPKEQPAPAAPMKLVENDSEPKVLKQQLSQSAASKETSRPVDSFVLFPPAPGTTVIESSVGSQPASKPTKPITQHQLPPPKQELHAKDYYVPSLWSSQPTKLSTSVSNAVAAVSPSVEYGSSVSAAAGASLNSRLPSVGGPARHLFDSAVSAANPAVSSLTPPGSATITPSSSLFGLPSFGAPSSTTVGGSRSLSSFGGTEAPVVQFPQSQIGASPMAFGGQVPTANAPLSQQQQQQARGTANPFAAERFPVDELSWRLSQLGGSFSSNSGRFQ